MCSIFAHCTDSSASPCWATGNVIVLIIVGAFVLDEICAVALGATCARLFSRALQRGITCAASVMTCTTHNLETRDLIGHKYVKI